MSALIVGTDPTRASYSSDTNFAPSPFSTLTQTVISCSASERPHLPTVRTDHEQKGPARG